LKLRRAVSLVFGLKEVNIAMNIMEFGEHSYLPGHQILIPRNWSEMKLRHAISLSFGVLAACYPTRI